MRLFFVLIFILGVNVPLISAMVEPTTIVSEVAAKFPRQGIKTDSTLKIVRRIRRGRLKRAPRVRRPKRLGSRRRLRSGRRLASGRRRR